MAGVGASGGAAVVAAAVAAVVAAAVAAAVAVAAAAAVAVAVAASEARAEVGTLGCFESRLPGDVEEKVIRFFHDCCISFLRELDNHEHFQR